MHVRECQPERERERESQQGKRAREEERAKSEKRQDDQSSGWVAGRTQGASEAQLACEASKPNSVRAAYLRVLWSDATSVPAAHPHSAEPARYRRRNSRYHERASRPKPQHAHTALRPPHIAAHLRLCTLSASLPVGVEWAASAHWLARARPEHLAT